MARRTLAALAAAAFLSVQVVPALADNAMGYSLVTAQDAAGMTRAGGALGMSISRAQRINSGGMAFDLLRVDAVNRGSAGAQAGLKAGDQIVAVDGHVFSDLQAFKAYVGSLPPGRQIAIDTIPPGGGPQQAQRITATVGNGGRAVQPDAQAKSTGMSTGMKVAIGLGALFGCYELGCFNKSQPVQAQPQR